MSRAAAFIALGCAVLSFFLPTSVEAAVAVDNVTSSTFSTSGGTSTFSFNHTIGGGANRYLVVGVSDDGNRGVPTVTYNAVSMTLIGSKAGSVNTLVSMFKLANSSLPAAGTYAVKLTYGGGNDVGQVGAISFTGVDQTTPVTTFNTASGVSTTPTVNVTSAAGELVVDTVAVATSTGTLIVDASQTERWRYNTVTPRGGGSTEAGAPTVTMSWSIGSAAWAIIAWPIKPATTTIADGTNPSSVTIAPGGAATNVDAFTLQTTGGTDTVTAATVTLAAGTFAGISLVEITNDNGGTRSGATVYGSVANPATAAVSFTSMSIPASTTLTTFRVWITPLSHAAMPLPAVGVTYTVTATVTAFTSTNPQSGTDTASATVTIDNQSPANVTSPLATTPSTTSVTVSWTNPGDADFSSLVVLRNTVTVPDVPVEGITYSVGNTINTSNVRYISNGTSFTDSSLTTNTTYFYRIFAKDSRGNYSATGVEVSATPGNTTTLADTTEPSSVTLAPGGAATMVDAFTLQTSSGSDTVTAVTVTLAAGTSAGLSLVEITNSGGTTIYGSATPSSDTVSVPTTTNTLSASTTLTTYKIRITPKTHAAMPAPPGGTYAVTATITAFTGTNVNQSETDTASATITIDNQSPANVTGASATPGAGQATVSWTNPGDADFSSLVVLRNTATITDVPVEGTTYSVGNTVGASTVRYILNGTSFIDTGLTAGTYYYRIFAKDSSGNYSATGVQVSATATPSVTLGEVASGGIESGGSTFSISHTTSGTNRVLLVGVSWGTGNQTVSSVTYAGTAMTSIGSADNVNNAHAQLFYLVAPATGTNTVLVTLSGAPIEIVVGAVTFTGANQTTPVGTFASATGSSTAPSVTVTSNTGETVLDTLFIPNSSTLTAGGGQTQQWQRNPKDWRGAGSTEPGASSVTMSWTSGNSAWAIGAVGVKPAAVCSSVPDATYVTAETQGTQATVYWSNSNPVLILRKTAAFGSEAPASGASYNVNEAIGAATVVFKGTSGTDTWFTDTGLTTGTTYYYKVFPKTSTPCYAPGIAVSVSPVANAVWGYSTTAASMIPPALDPWSNVVVTGSNDNNFHGMVESDGTLKFAPAATGGPIQARPAAVPATYRTPAGTGVNIAYVTSQDGYVYAVNTGTGVQVWQSPSLAGANKLQGGTAVWLQVLKPLTVCGITSTPDVVFVGTKDTSTTTGNKVYALNGSGGSVTIPGGQGGGCAAAGTWPAGAILWTYTGTAMDIISSTPYVDFTNNTVWVTSRSNAGTQASVWKFNAANGALIASFNNTLLSETDTSASAGSDSSPVPNADGAFVYVGTNFGNLKAIKVSNGAVSSHTPSSGTGAIKGMPWPLSYSAASGATPDQIIFSRTATVHSVKFDGTNFLICPANCWTTTPTGGPATVSAPVDDGAGNLYIGGSEGKVHRLLVSNGSDAAQVPATGVSGTLGDPTFNYDLNKIHIGASDGHIYTFATGF